MTPEFPDPRGFADIDRATGLDASPADDGGDGATDAVTDGVAGDSRHVAVIDLGSNSVRLVVYDRQSRTPFPRFNEKFLCRLGASLDEDGNLGEEAMDCAVRAVERFAAIAAAMRVRRIDLLATEATRNASNGAAFRERLEAASGLKVRVLDGDDEARLAATGVIAGFHEPDGLVGDLGGGSLEIAGVRERRVDGHRVSMPIGALHVAERLAHASVVEVRRDVDEILRRELPGVVPGGDFYVVGGGWRVLAKVHLANHRRRVPVIHGLILDPRTVRKRAKLLSAMRGDEPSAVEGVPGRRVPTVPAAALVLDRVLKHLQPDRVLFSALGMREGWLYEQLSAQERAEDPLLAGCHRLAAETIRVPEFAGALERFTDVLFVGESVAQRRLRVAATALSDLVWREHADVQARHAAERILRFPLVGLTHVERAFLATSVHSRYGGKPAKLDASALLDGDDATRAHVLGTAMLLGHRFSGGVPAILDRSRIRVDADAVTLEVDDAARVPGRAVRKRLRRLAKALGRPKSAASVRG